MIPKNITEDSSSSMVCCSWWPRLKQSLRTSTLQADKPPSSTSKSNNPDDQAVTINENKNDTNKQNPDYDNHYSYIEPDDYIEFRLRKLKRMYQKLLPNSVWSQKVWVSSFLLIYLTLTASF